MPASDVTARVAAAFELLVVLMNLVFAFMWFISLALFLVGFLWALLGILVLVEGAIAVFVLIKGYSPVGIAGPVIGLLASVCNFNLFMGLPLEFLVLVLMIVALVLRGQEDAAAAA